jgi:hypothetical protein
MLRRLYPCVIKKRISNHPPARIFDPKGRKYQPAGRLTDSEWGCCVDCIPHKEKGFPTIHQQEYFDPKGRKISSSWQTDSTRLGMLCRLYPRNKEKDFQPSTSKNISTLRVENINQLAD